MSKALEGLAEARPFINSIDPAIRHKEENRDEKITSARIATIPLLYYNSI